MHAIRQDILPPSGVEFATCLNLTFPDSSTSQSVFCNVVVARKNFVRIFQVREDPAPLRTHADDEHERKLRERRGTEAVEGEVEMDRQGEGFVNVGSAKVSTTF